MIHFTHTWETEEQQVSWKQEKIVKKKKCVQSVSSNWNGFRSKWWMVIKIMTKGYGKVYIYRVNLTCSVYR